MKQFRKQHKRIYASYKKRLRALHKQTLDLNDPTEYFVTYLRLLRDYYLLTGQKTTEIRQDQFELSSLIAAISEYEKSQSCIHNYYKVDNGVVSRIIDGTEEEILEKYSTEKAFHWDAFWNLVRLGLESWVTNVKLR
jgi:hypothetical protein